MHEIIFVSQIILGRTRSKIAVLVDVNSKIISNNSPDSDIEFSIIIQKWLLNVFLYHPKRILLVFLKYKFRNVSHVFKYLDASALIKRCRFYEPHVACAVLDRNSFIFWSSSRNLSETVHEFIDFMVVNVSSDYICGRCRIEDAIFCINSCFVVFIISGKRFYQHSLSTNSPIYFQMIEQERFNICLQAAVQVIILFEVKIELFPEKVGLLNRVLLIDLSPVTSFLQLFDNVARKISFSDCESIFAWNSGRLTSGWIPRLLVLCSRWQRFRRMRNEALRLLGWLYHIVWISWEEPELLNLLLLLLY